MYSALHLLCAVLFIACAPLLLVTRFISKRFMPWWLVALATVVVSTGLGIAFDYLGPRAHYEEQEACWRAHEAFSRECPFGTYDVWVIPVPFKWVPGVLWLVASLPFYGLAVWLRARHRSRNQIHA
jgi:hypothetical protein